MVFEQMEALKRQYTDKYVVVDETRPELRRFAGQTGTVRTVNMSGRALVEFDANLNTGWYDIDVDFLRIIDEPLPKPEPVAKAEPEKKKPAAAKKPAAKKPGGGMSVEEMLAAARGEKTVAAEAEDPKAAAASSQPAAKQMSVEEMLAAARGEKSSSAAAPAPVAEPAVEEAPAAEETPASEPKGDLPTNTDEMIAYCRKVDG